MRLVIYQQFACWKNGLFCIVLYRYKIAQTTPDSRDRPGVFLLHIWVQ
jgi:hypothetical protein